MVLFINSNPNGLARINGTFLDETIEFSELAVIPKEKSIWLAGHVTSANVQVRGQHDYTFIPQLCTFEIHTDAYEKNVKKGDAWEKEAASPSIPERAIAKILKDLLSFQLGSTSALTGSINFDTDLDTALGVLQGNQSLEKYYLPNPTIIERTEITKGIEAKLEELLNKPAFGSQKGSFKNALEIADERVLWIAKQLDLTALIDEQKASKTSIQVIAEYLKGLSQSDMELTNAIYKLLSLGLK